MTNSEISEAQTKIATVAMAAIVPTGQALNWTPRNLNRAASLRHIGDDTWGAWAAWEIAEAVGDDPLSFTCCAFAASHTGVMHAHAERSGLTKAEAVEVYAEWRVDLATGRKTPS